MEKLTYVAAKVPEDLLEEFLEVCMAVYETKTVSGCIREMMKEFVKAYRRLKPTKEAMQRTLLEMLKSRY